MAEPEATQVEQEFEEIVAAALKVDPKGMSGKHRKELETEGRPSDEG